MFRDSLITIYKLYYILILSFCWIYSFRLLILVRMVVLALFMEWRVSHPNDDAFWLWGMSVVCEICKFINMGKFVFITLFCILNWILSSDYICKSINMGMSVLDYIFYNWTFLIVFCQYVIIIMPTASLYSIGIFCSWVYFELQTRHPKPLSLEGNWF